MSEEEVEEQSEEEAFEFESEESEEEEEKNEDEEKKERDSELKEAEAEETPEISPEEQLRKMKERKDVAVSDYVEEHEYIKIVTEAATDLSKNRDYIVRLKEAYIKSKETDHIKIAIELFFLNVLPYILHRYIQNGYVKVKLKQLKRHARWRYDPEGGVDASQPTRNPQAPSDVHSQTFE
jgi:hypothetical protein